MHVQMHSYGTKLYGTVEQDAGFDDDFLTVTDVSCYRLCPVKKNRRRTPRPASTVP